MSTNISSKPSQPSDPVSLTVRGRSDDRVHFAITTSGPCVQINVDREALLDAVRSELGVLIIDKADLPEVTITGGGNLTVDGEIYVAHDADFHRQAARASLALAEYLEAHPPVDEQQVEALAGLIETQKVGVTETAKDVARRLLSTGKVTVQS